MPLIPAMIDPLGGPRSAAPRCDRSRAMVCAAAPRPWQPGPATRPWRDRVTIRRFTAGALVVTACMTVLGAACATGLAPRAAAARGGDFDWPLLPRPAVVRAFDKPEHDWLPGHRGVDLAGAHGQSVLAAGDGIVVFAGIVAGKPVVSIDHPGRLRTTYEPVSPAIPVGRRVIRGDPLGTLQPGHASCSPCLHWGARRDREYVDPLGLVRATPIRLKPLESSSATGRLSERDTTAGKRPAALSPPSGSRSVPTVSPHRLSSIERTESASGPAGERTYRDRAAPAGRQLGSAGSHPARLPG